MESAVAQPSFSDLGLAPELLRAIAEQGYTQPTPIQLQAIPVVLRGQDLMGGAQTGTGKTAAFTLPLLHLMKEHANTSVSPARHPVRALILTPTRELAAQVEESVRGYSKYLPLRSTVVYGGVDMVPQTKALRSGVEILVATPGRLLDHMQSKTLFLSQVQYLVLDEADRMLDMGFLPDIRRILSALPAQRQNLLFSATFAEDIRKLADQFIRQPVLIEVARRNATAELVSHLAYTVSSRDKLRCLAHLIQSRGLTQLLVFMRTKQGADRLTRSLQRFDINAAAIHSDKTQPQRTQVLADFKAGNVQALVATDIAARGLDIEGLPQVINYELPYAAEDYVHRIGRTGRAGLPGEAISLVDDEELELLARIERLIKRQIPREAGRLPVGVSAITETGSARPLRETSRRETHARPDRDVPASVHMVPLAQSLARSTAPIEIPDTPVIGPPRVRQVALLLLAPRRAAQAAAEASVRMESPEPVAG